MTESETKSLTGFNTPMMKRTLEPEPVIESSPLTRPGFPILTVIWTIGLIILAAVTLIRNHHRGIDSPDQTSQPLSKLG